MRATSSWIASVALCAAVAGCGGSGDERPELTVAEPLPPAIERAAPQASAESETTPESGSVAVSAAPLSARQREEIRRRAAATAVAIRRWGDDLARCVGPKGDGDNADATCTHAAWEQLVDQVEIEMYYLLEHLRAMPSGACHKALAAENDILRGFWHGAAPLDLAWLDEQQRPPSRFDLEAAVDLVRPVPARIRDATKAVCAG